MNNLSKTMKTIRFLNTLWMFLLCVPLTGAIIYRFELHETPCPLCLLQRLSMIGIGVAVLMNLRLGIRPQHYALAIGNIVFGGAVSLRQISLHVCPQFSIFGTQVFGLELYTWAFLVFVSSLIGLMLLLILQPNDARQYEKPAKMNFWAKAITIYLSLIIIYNVIMIYLLCGFGPCVG